MFEKYSADPVYTGKSAPARSFPSPNKNSELASARARRGKTTGKDFQGLQYRLTSRLLIADGCPDDGDKWGTYFYEWLNEKFRLCSDLNSPKQRQSSHSPCFLWNPSKM